MIILRFFARWRCRLFHRLVYTPVHHSHAVRCEDCGYQWMEYD